MFKPEPLPMNSESGPVYGWWIAIFAMSFVMWCVAPLSTKKSVCGRPAVVVLTWDESRGGGGVQDVAVWRRGTEIEHILWHYTTGICRGRVYDFQGVDLIVQGAWQGAVYCCCSWILPEHSRWWVGQGSVAEQRQLRVHGSEGHQR